MLDLLNRPPALLLLLTSELVLLAPNVVHADDSALTVAAVLTDGTALAGVHDIEIQSGLAYVAGKGGSLAVVDVRQPAAPKLLWSVRDQVAYEDAETVLPLDDNR